MCPFVDEEEEEGYAAQIFQTPKEGVGVRSQFFRNDKKLFLLGGGAVVAALVIISYILYSNSKPINLEELPIISADGTPFKVKPEIAEEVKHQDKIVYDNISGQKRVVQEKIAPPPEGILSIPEINNGESLSAEEKKNIIQAFDDLAPENEYQIEYVKDSSASKRNTSQIKSPGLVIVEEDRPPFKKVEENNAHVVASKQKSSPKGFLAKNRSEHKTILENGLFVQIASVATKSAAEIEYTRILSRNKFLRKHGKKIIKVDFGEKKGIKYRIQVGPFKNKEEADKIISKMKKNGFPAYISK
ncbi:MAG: SPOR domain-containing protein [Holosporaceae bacterium]|jgi:cell division protein FtsN|nr:SPOR domain-containing protein [Holosporaceae bacterium]